MRALLADPDADKVRGSDLSEFLMNFKTAVRKKRKRYIVHFSKVVHLKSGISGTNADDFYLSTPFIIRLDFAVNIVDDGSLPLTVRSIHAEDFDDNHFCFNILDCKCFLTGGKPQIVPVQ